MKNTLNRAQRNFVVEYKSKSRRPKVEAKSIWGDTNFKALAQAVAEDMPHTGTGSEDAGRSYRRQETVVARAEANSPASITPFEIAISTTTSDMRALSVDKAEMQSVSPTAREPEGKQPRRTAVVGNVRKATASEVSAPARTPAHSTTTDHYDILAVLEMENRRLKQLLADKLRSENSLMRGMLQRFEARPE